MRVCTAEGCTTLTEESSGPEPDPGRAVGPSAIPEAENYIQWRLSDMAARNEHHLFETVATRVARRRISSNILIATGPVSAGGDQQRDAETYTTRIPDELPHSAGFSASASTAPVVVACTVQRDGLKAKVRADLAGICASTAAPVEHVAFFCAHSIPEAATHELQREARDTYDVTLDIFCGVDIAMMLAEPDLVWVAQYYLDMASALVPEPVDADPHPEWYPELLENLRRNSGPAALTPATQGEVTAGLRYATWDEHANADLPEWLDFMGAFLADSDDGVDTDLVFRACYEMAVARFRGMGLAAGIEDLVRRAISYACTSAERIVVDDATTLASYWGVMWVTGVAEAESAEIQDACDRLRAHVSRLLAATDSADYPVRAASLTGTLAFASLVPNWTKAEEINGRPKRAERAENAGVQLDETDVDPSALLGDDLIDIDSAMDYFGQLVDLLPRARAYSVRQLARVFNMYATAAASHSLYEKVRDALDASVSGVQGDSATAERCRDRGMAFVKANKPMHALVELHNAKLNWFNGDTLYGSVLTMRYIGSMYAGLGLMYAAKMYAATAAAMALSSGDSDVEPQAAKALLEAARYAQRAGTWVDAAGLTEIALLGRAQFLPEPFDYERWPDLGHHETNAILGLTAIRTFWPEVEPLIQAAHHRTPWYDDLVEIIGIAEGEASFNLTEDELQERASEQLAGPVLGDIGENRIIDFRALGVRWIFEFANDQSTVLISEGFVAAFQVLVAEAALHTPVLVESTVRIHVRVIADATRDVDDITVDDSEPEIRVQAVLSDSVSDVAARDVAILAQCFQLLQAVHARHPRELQDILDPLFRGGLPHKVSVGRSYEEAAALLDEEHYARCASVPRPESSASFIPAENEHLAPPTTLGPGYDSADSLQAIRERYEVAYDAFRYTLPGLLADEGFRAQVVRLREDGWLDWQILVALVNARMNWLFHQNGMQPELVDPREGMRIAREPETPDSPRMQVEELSPEILDMHLYMQAVTIGRRMGLQGRQEQNGEHAMRGLLIRRYRFAEDDLPHRDLLDCVDEDGKLIPFVVPETDLPAEDQQ